ncbi:Poly [ADP-ribose] polymerase 14 [Oryzias melastigma]|uniref:Poly [ADP-ribose] polymerase 14 n=1 Tax=Oryzias melastigma TaxID=30732 RepID=A0A834FD84_ORYME|nr:Poly [ADP-ribose] polymerase 14 [Oryzias melastigma]
MAGAYSHRVVVELEKSDIPKVKNKLVKYFQSRRSGGGDCQVDYEEGSSTAVLRFSREEEKRKVLDKECHEISLEKGVLKMKVRLPSDEQTGQKKAPPEEKQKSKDAEIREQELPDEGSPSPDSAEEELSSTSVVLENVPEENQPGILGNVGGKCFEGSRLIISEVQFGNDSRNFLSCCDFSDRSRKRQLYQSLPSKPDVHQEGINRPVS